MAHATSFRCFYDFFLLSRSNVQNSRVILSEYLIWTKLTQTFSFFLPLAVVGHTWWNEWAHLVVICPNYCSGNFMACKSQLSQSRFLQPFLNLRNYSSTRTWTNDWIDRWLEECLDVQLGYLKTAGSSPVTENILLSELEE